MSGTGRVVSHRPLCVKDMYDGLPEQMFRLMVARGLTPTLGLRFMALDLANLALTGRARFPEDSEPVTTPARTSP